MTRRLLFIPGPEGGGEGWKGRDGRERGQWEGGCVWLEVRGRR